MTEESLPYKVGDAVWFVSSFDPPQRCTVTRLNAIKLFPEIITVSVELDDGRRLSCLPSKLHAGAEPPERKIKRTMSFEEVVAGYRFKPGDRVMQSNYGFGVVIGFSPTLAMRVDFKYFGERHVDPTSLNVWFAKAGDEERNPLLPPEPMPEPLCAPAKASIENLALEIDNWTARVRGFSHGFDCSEEYQHDLMAREEVHGVVNGLQQSGASIPIELKIRLDEADRWFMELTKDDQGVWHDSSRYDRNIFWYYFRWLKQ